MPGVPGDDLTRVRWKVNLQCDAEAKSVILQFTSWSRSLPFSCLHLLNPGSVPTQPGNNLSCVSSPKPDWSRNDYKLAKLWNQLPFIFIMWTLKEQTHSTKKTYATKKTYFISVPSRDLAEMTIIALIKKINSLQIFVTFFSQKWEEIILVEFGGSL